MDILIGTVMVIGAMLLLTLSAINYIKKRKH